MIHAASLRPKPHLAALVIAALALIPVLALCFPVFTWLERPYLRDLVTRPFKEKDQGIILQKWAGVKDDVISIYGSSELRNEMDKRPDELFSHEIKGFQVCPIGAAGNTTLMMAQKIAAMGDAVRDQKVVCILSHTWFRRPETPADQVDGNFSPLQMVSLIETPELPADLRHRFYKRFLDYGKTMNRLPLIGAYLSTAEGEDKWSRMGHELLKPALWVYGKDLLLQDHLNTVEAIVKLELYRHAPWAAREGTVGWHRMIKLKEAQVPPEDRRAVYESYIADHGPGDADFIELMESAKEWDDFALLLDTLKALKADALIVSVPMPGPSLSRKGISRAARDHFYKRIESMSKERGIAAATFSDQDMAIDFLEGSGTHLEVKGWLYVDQLLDAFYHNRLKK